MIGKGVVDRTPQFSIGGVDGSSKFSARIGWYLAGLPCTMISEKMTLAKGAFRDRSRPFHADLSLQACACRIFPYGKESVMRHIEFEAKLRYQEYQEQAEALKQLRQVPRIHLLRKLATYLTSLADRLDPPVVPVVTRQDCVS